MANLTAAKRAHIAPKNFGQPATKGFPMNDATHARLAIGGATRAYNAGNISKATEERIQAKARTKLASSHTAHDSKGSMDRMAHDSHSSAAHAGSVPVKAKDEHFQ